MYRFYIVLLSLAALLPLQVQATVPVFEYGLKACQVLAEDATATKKKTEGEAEEEPEPECD